MSDTNYQNDPSKASKNKIQKHLLREPTEYPTTSTTTLAVDAKRRQLMFPNVKGIQDLRVQSQGTKMPSSASIKGGAKGNSTVNFRPFLLNQNVCFPKNSRRSVKGIAQLAFLALHATGPHATCLLRANPLIPTHFHHVWQH